ncbi:hypothetical protein MAH4_23530 [Sessilibacter sp. MAH4]
MDNNHAIVSDPNAVNVIYLVDTLIRFIVSFKLKLSVDIRLELRLEIAIYAHEEKAFQ